MKTIYYKNNKLDKKRTYPALLKYAALDLLSGRKPQRVVTEFSDLSTD